MIGCIKCLILDCRFIFCLVCNKVIKFLKLCGLLLFVSLVFGVEGVGVGVVMGGIVFVIGCGGVGFVLGFFGVFGGIVVGGVDVSNCVVFFGGGNIVVEIRCNSVILVVDRVLGVW